jgi:hypothetical protein
VRGLRIVVGIRPELFSYTILCTFFLVIPFSLLFLVSWKMGALAVMFAVPVCMVLHFFFERTEIELRAIRFLPAFILERIVTRIYISNEEDELWAFYFSEWTGLWRRGNWAEVDEQFFEEVSSYRHKHRAFRELEKILVEDL